MKVIDEGRGGISFLYTFHIIIFMMIDIDYFRGRLSNQNTYNTYNRIIKRFLEWQQNSALNEIKIDQNTAEAFIQYLKERGASPSTLNIVASAIKKFAEINGQYFKITNVPQINQKVPDILSKEEIDALIDGIKDIRDKAIVSLLYDCALRISELVNLNCSDIDMENRLIFLEHRKKSRSPQKIPFSKRTKALLERYLEERDRRGFDKKTFPELFVGAGGRLSADGIRRNLREYGLRILGKRVQPHMLRHSRASHLRDRGMSLDLLREFLGHRRIDTTLIYARLSPTELKSRLEELESEDKW